VNRSGALEDRSTFDRIHRKLKDAIALRIGSER
jgi:hypothetical protein